MNALILAVGTASLQGVLIQFLIAILVLACIGGLLYAIERWVHPIPSMVKLVVAIALVIGLVIWGLRAFGVA